MFGYAPRYAEYKYAPSTIHGEFRTSLANWTFARKLSAANLNSDFLSVPDINNPFAVQDGSDKYLIWISHRIDALQADAILRYAVYIVMGKFKTQWEPCAPLLHEIGEEDTAIPDLTYSITEMRS